MYAACLQSCPLDLCALNACGLQISIVKLRHLRVRALAEVLWALACWGYTPTAEWMREYFSVTHVQLEHGFRTQHLANTVLALKKLGCKVGPHALALASCCFLFWGPRPAACNLLYESICPLLALASCCCLHGALCLLLLTVMMPAASSCLLPSWALPHWACCLLPCLYLLPPSWCPLPAACAGAHAMAGLSSKLLLQEAP